MCLEESVSGKEFHQNTADAPNIAGEAPAEVQDDFRRAVVASGHDGGVVFVIKRRRAEINQSDLTVEENSALPGIAICGMGGRGDCAVVSEGLIGVADEEDVFGFKIGVDKVEVVEDWGHVSVKLEEREKSD